MRSFLRTLILFPAVALAWMIYWVRVNRIEKLPGRPDRLSKYRTVGSWIPIELGNVVFRCRRPRVKVLPKKNWIAWELAVGQATGSDVALGPNECLTMPLLSGLTLSEWLQQPEVDEGMKLRRVAQAAAALKTLHDQPLPDQVDERWEIGGRSNSVLAPPVGRVAPFPRVNLSHADASVTNVMISPEGALATWFDFDMQHALTECPLVRQADDLRAFLFTAAVCTRWESLAALISTVRLAYNDEVCFGAMKRQVCASRFAVDVVHLAQLRRAGKNFPEAIRISNQLISQWK